jgi:hypothetical protein
MPVDYDQRFAEWMATPPSSGRLIEGVAVLGNWWIGGMWFARGIFEPVVLPDEHGASRTWAPANIELQLPSARPSLEQEVVVTFSDLRADQVAAFDRMPPERLAGITTVRLYVWLDPGGLDAPLVSPPPRLVIEEVKLASNAIELTCTGPLLPNWRAGSVYTVEAFPGLSTE